MSCKFLKLTNCEITGATYQGRKINFLNKDITADTFVAKVFDKDGFSISEIVGVKLNSMVYFPFTSLQMINKPSFTIRYWANLVGIGDIQFAEEELIISDSYHSGTPQDPTTPFYLKIGSEIVNFNIESVYLNVSYSGTTLQRPLSQVTGFQFFDTTLNKPIWVNSVGIWVDSNGQTI